MGFPVVCDKCFTTLFFDPQTNLWHCDKCYKTFRKPPIIKDEDVLEIKHDDEPDEKWL